MATDIELAINRLQAVHRAILAPDGRPILAPDLEGYLTVLDTPNLPYVMTWPGQGSSYIKGGGYRTDERVLEVFCFVEPVGQNDIPSRTRDAVRLLQSIRAAYVTPSILRLTDIEADGYQTTIESGPGGQRITDTGVTAANPFGGRAFVGFRISVTARILWGSGAVGV